MPKTLVDCTVKELVKVLRGFEIVVWNLQIVNTSKFKVLIFKSLFLAEDVNK